MKEEINNYDEYANNLDISSSNNSQVEKNFDNNNNHENNNVINNSDSNSKKKEKNIYDNFPINQTTVNSQNKKITGIRSNRRRFMKTKVNLKELKKIKFCEECISKFKNYIRPIQPIQPINKSINNNIKKIYIRLGQNRIIPYVSIFLICIITIFNFLSPENISEQSEFRNLENINDSANAKVNFLSFQNNFNDKYDKILQNNYNSTNITSPITEENYPSNENNSDHMNNRILQNNCYPINIVSTITEKILNTSLISENNLEKIKNDIQYFNCREHKSLDIYEVNNFNYKNISNYELEEILKLKFFLDFSTDGAPFLTPTRKIGDNITFYCYWEIHYESQNNNYLNMNYNIKFNYTYCIEKFLKRFDNSKKLVKEIIKKKGYDYDSLKFNVRNYILTMQFNGLFLDDWEDTLNYFYIGNYIEAIKSIKNSQWVNRFPQQVNYNLYLFENNIFTIVPFYMIDIRKYIFKYSKQYQTSYYFIENYKTIINLLKDQNKLIEVENKISTDIHLFEYIDENNDQSIFFRMGKLRFLREIIYYFKNLKYQIDYSVLENIKVLMEKIFYERKQDDLDNLYYLLNTLRRKNEL